MANDETSSNQGVWEKEYDRRVDLVMSAFVQEYFLRENESDIHPCELLNKLLILVQFPMTFMVCQNDKSGIIKKRSFIDQDIFGSTFTEAVNTILLPQKKYKPFVIYQDKRDAITYTLYPFIVTKGKNKEVSFSPICKNIGYHPKDTKQLERQVCDLLNRFFKYFNEKSELSGIKKSFVGGVKKGFKAFFDTSPYSMKHSVSSNRVSQNIAEAPLLKLDDFYKSFEHDVLAKVYSKKIKNFSLTVKELTQSKESHSKLPNIVLYSKTIMPLNEERRAKVHDDSLKFEGYNFNTKIVASESQIQDLTKFLDQLRVGYSSYGAEHFNRIELKLYSQSEADTDLEKEILVSYDQLFLDILMGKKIVDCKTGEISEPIISSPEEAIECILDVYFKQAGKNMRALADSVFLTGLVNIRFPFEKSGGLGLLTTQTSPLSCNSTKCDVDALGLAVKHYIFEGLSPLSSNIDTHSLALISFPIYVAGRVPIVAGHLLQVEKEALASADDEELTLILSTGAWDQVFFLNQSLGKEIKSNFRRGYILQFYRDIEKIFDDSFSNLLGSYNCTEEDVSNVISDISKKVQSLSFYYPFYEVVITGKIIDNKGMFDLETEKGIAKGNIFIGNILFQISAKVNDIYLASSAGNPYHKDSDTFEQEVREHLARFIKSFADKVLSKVLSFNSDVSPRSYLTKQCVKESLGIEQSNLLLEIAQAKYAKNAGEHYDLKLKEEDKNFLFSIATTKRAEVLSMLDRRKDPNQENDFITRYSKSEYGNALSFLEQVYGEYLDIFNGGQGNFLFSNELRKLDKGAHNLIFKYCKSKGLNFNDFIPKPPKEDTRALPKKSR